MSPHSWANRRAAQRPGCQSGPWLSALARRRCRRVRTPRRSGRSRPSRARGRSQFLLGDVVVAADDIQARQDAHAVQLRVIMDRVGWAATEARLTREEAAARRIGAGQLMSVAEASQRPRWIRGCPCRGLRSFDEADAEVFHGRERMTAELAGRVARQLDETGILVVTVFMVSPWFDPGSGSRGAGRSGRECRVPSPLGVGRGSRRRPGARLPSRQRLRAACLVAGARAWSQRVSLSAGGRVRSMTIAATAQAAHPAMESNAPMFGYHDTCAGPTSVCMVMPATPARVERE